MVRYFSKLNTKSFYSYILLFLLAFTSASAQSPVEIKDNVDQHIFTYNEIEVLKDATGKLTLQDLQNEDIDKQFRPSLSSTPQTLDLNTNYWFKIKIKSNSAANKHYILE
ncbi:MAG: chromosome partitioning protein ParA, partial [Pedobacter sp.]|nr:chromosome partitioning protein ParA [Pedobacter sp.]